MLYALYHAVPTQGGTAYRVLSQLELRKAPGATSFTFTATDPTAAVKNVRKLISEDKVDAILGPNLISTAVAMADVANGEKVPMISVAPLDVSGDKRGFVFRSEPSADLMVGRVVADMVEGGAKTVGFIGFSDSWGELLLKAINKTTEQANVVLGVPGVARDDERRFTLGVLNASLGGGMSSRLFQEIREKRGLAYSVFSFAAHFADTGQFGVYAGCMPKKVDDVLAITREELAKVAAHGLTDEELARGKGQVRGGLVLGLEDTGSRMSRIGKAELLNGRLWSTGEVLHAIDSVSVVHSCST